MENYYIILRRSREYLQPGFYDFQFKRIRTDQNSRDTVLSPASVALTVSTPTLCNWYATTTHGLSPIKHCITSGSGGQDHEHTGSSRE